MFEVLWQLEGSEWQRASAARVRHAAGSDYDRAKVPLHHLLWGHFDLRLDRSSLYGVAHPVHLSILDFGCFVARALAIPRAFDRDVVFDQLDDDRHVRFEVLDDASVRISANDGTDTVLISRDALVAGLRRFVVDLAHAIDRHDPTLFDWQSLAPLAEYRSA